jgi:hypothetical protein
LELPHTPEAEIGATSENTQPAITPVKIFMPRVISRIAAVTILLRRGTEQAGMNSVVVHLL